MLLHFEDFAVGQKLALDGRYEVTKEEIVAFARAYDPQPMHLDEAAAEHSILGGLAASGWHVCAMAMRLIVDGLFAKAASAGGAGVEQCRWLRPVRPGDVLRLEVEVLETRTPRSRGDIGFVKARWNLFDQRERVATIVSTPMFLRRGDVVFEELEIGSKRELGAYTFGAEEMIAFARQYDPQSYHVDPEAAKGSVFGGLIASGWLTTAIWMKLMIADRQAHGNPGGGAVSPGFDDLIWQKPVRPGTTLFYSTEVVAKREVKSRPSHGLVTSRNEARDAGGALYMSMVTKVLVEKKGDRQ